MEETSVAVGEGVVGVEDSSKTDVKFIPVGGQPTPSLPEKPQYHENQLLGFRFFPDGRKEIRWVKGEPTPMDLPDELLLPINGKFKDKHRQTLMAISEFGKQAAAMKRSVAMLQDEAVKNGLDKTVIKDLERLGLVETAMVEIKVKDGRNLGGRKIIVLSPQGKAFVRTVEDAMREVIAMAQAPEENPKHEEGVRSDATT